MNDDGTRADDASGGAAPVSRGDEKSIEVTPESRVSTSPDKTAKKPRSPEPAMNEETSVRSMQVDEPAPAPRRARAADADVQSQSHEVTSADGAAMSAAAIEREWEELQAQLADQEWAEEQMLRVAREAEEQRARGIADDAGVQQEQSHEVTQQMEEDAYEATQAEPQMPEAELGGQRASGTAEMQDEGLCARGGGARGAQGGQRQTHSHMK